LILRNRRHRCGIVVAEQAGRSDDRVEDGIQQSACCSRQVVRHATHNSARCTSFCCTLLIDHRGLRPFSSFSSQNSIQIDKLGRRQGSLQPKNADDQHLRELIRSKKNGK
jgi:hypothetical protein